MKNTLLTINQGKFAKFCVAVSFTLVDLKFHYSAEFQLNTVAVKTYACKGKQIF